MVTGGPAGRRRALATALAVAALVACAAPAAPERSADAPSGAVDTASAPDAAPTPVAADASPEAWRVRVLAVRPHDPASFTQGLVFHDGVLYESVGLYGESALLRVDPATGKALQRVDLPADRFGEGLARVGERLVQLTWREGEAYVYDLRTLRRERVHRYPGEGWGLAFDGRRLVLSDGSDRLSWRDPATFAEVDGRRVTLSGAPVERLNELEWAEGALYANVLGEDVVLRLDPASGRVTAVVDAAGLLAPEERRSADVLNGIAHDPARGVFYLTGKLWPKLFEVVFEPAGAD
jgi:glutaminyl-peptide cyclotransferase